MAVPSESAAWRVLVTGGAGFIGSRLVKRLAEGWPNAKITVIDDFRSGDFKNLSGFTGDLVAGDVSRMNLKSRFAPKAFDAIFHLASITDTTVSDQLVMCHDNIEGHRNVLEYAKEGQIPVTYASSASTYGVDGEEGRANVETDPREPANVYGYSKTQLENLTQVVLENPDNTGWKINGVRYFNVYGPFEQHKGKMASMVYQLYLQMKQGKRPRVFEHGEQMRDFVHVDDAVEGTIRAMGSGTRGIFNLGCGVPFSFNQLIAELNKALGTSLEPEYFPNPYSFAQAYTCADLTRSRENIGYEPAYPPEAGIAAYVKWLEERQ